MTHTFPGSSSPMQWYAHKFGSTQNLERLLKPLASLPQASQTNDSVDPFHKFLVQDRRSSKPCPGRRPPQVQRKPWRSQRSFLSEALRFNPSTSNNVRTASSVPFASPNLVTTVKSSKYDVIRMPNRLHPTLFTAAAVRKNACTDAIAPKSIVAISEPRTLFWIGSYMQITPLPLSSGSIGNCLRAASIS